MATITPFKILAVLTLILGLATIWHAEWKAAQGHAVVVHRTPADIEADRAFDRQMPASSEGIRDASQALRQLGK